MIEAKIVYRVRCEVCREPFGEMYATALSELLAMSKVVYQFMPFVRYDGPHVCPACGERQKEEAK